MAKIKNRAMLMTLRANMAKARAALALKVKAEREAREAKAAAAVRNGRPHRPTVTPAVMASWHYPVKLTMSEHTAARLTLVLARGANLDTIASEALAEWAEAHGEPLPPMVGA